jgi:histidinol-phosphatase (PHP family)
MEVDMYSKVPMDGFDYLIGSVHYLKKDDRYLGFDRSAQQVAELIKTEFSGDGMIYARLYYETLSQLPRYGKFDIIGHFDLITKHAENVSFFDHQSRQYRGWAIEAAEALAGKIPFFEINTGAIALGYRTTSYPDSFILKELKRLGFGAVISSDCHDRRKLACGYDDARERLLDAGFREFYMLTDNGFKPVSL